jgi:hypothetical protein
MRRLVACVLVVTSSGCLGLTRRNRPGAALADLSAIGGLVLVAKHAGCEEPPPMPDPFGFDWQTECVGADLAVGAGIALLLIGGIGGAILLSDEYERPAEERVGAPVVTVTPGPPLPDLPAARVDEVTLRFARQARRATAAGDCAGARASLAAVARRDSAYHADLLASGALAACL